MISLPTAIAGIAIASSVALGTAAVVSSTTGEESKTASDGRFPIDVTRIVDGDTLEASFEGGSHRVRLILIDTPELKNENGSTECLAPEAKDRLGALLPEGSTAYAEYDTDRIDPYGRKLLYLWDGSDAFVNKELVSEGLARVMHVPPNGKYLSEISSAARRADSEGVGLRDASIGCSDATVEKLREQEELEEARELAEQEEREIAARKAKARAKAKAKRKAQRERARAKAAREREREQAWSPPSTGNSGGYDGYNGPRCYAPGGKTWRPC